MAICTQESGYGQHKSDYDCADPVRAGDVAPVLIVLFHRSMSRRPRMGTTPRWPVVLGSDAGVMLGPVATNGEFLFSVKVIRAITTTIAARTAMMVSVAPLAKASSGPFVPHGWFLVPLNRAHPCLGSGLAPSPGLGHAVVYAARAASPRSAGAWFWELRIAPPVPGRQLLGFL